MSAPISTLTIFSFLVSAWLFSTNISFGVVLYSQHHSTHSPHYKRDVPVLCSCQWTAVCSCMLVNIIYIYWMLTVERIHHWCSLQQKESLGHRIPWIAEWLQLWLWLLLWLEQWSNRHDMKWLQSVLQEVEIVLETHEAEYALAHDAYSCYLFHRYRSWNCLPLRSISIRIWRIFSYCL